MSAIRSRDNRTEVALRQSLHALGLRFRLHRRDLPGRPDIVFARERVAIFVDGDYWHARSVREATEDPYERFTAERRDYWRQKFERRIQLDDTATAALKASGWIVL